MKTITHIYAIVAAAVGAFLLTPAGAAVLQQYPKLASLLAVATVLGLYHNPNKPLMGVGAMKVVIPLFLAFTLVAPAHAQTPAPQGLPFTVAGNFSASTNNVIPQGIQSTFEYAVKGRWSLRVDDLKQGSILSNFGEGQWGLTADRIFGKGSPVSFQNIRFNIHAGLGAVKDATGGMNFGAVAGVSVDYKVSTVFFLRLLEFNDAYSRGYTPRNQFFGGNYNSTGFGSGIGFNF